MNRVRKLQAAKDALHYFVSNLSFDEQAAIYTFDEKQKQDVQLTNNRDDLNSAIDRIEVSDSATKMRTSLYISIKYALEEAKKNGIRHLVVLTDGKEDTKKSRDAYAEGSLPELKAGEEESIGKKAREYGIPIHTIAIGDPSIPVEYSNDRSEEAVDTETLKQISSKANNGLSRFINIPQLGAGKDPKTFLTDELKDVLMEIKKRAKYNYVQTIVLPDLPEGAGRFLLTVTIEKDRKYIPFTAEYDVFWNKGSGPPISILQRVGRQGLINPKPPIEWSRLTQIYFALFLPLALLALLPSVYGRIALAHEMRRMDHAIEVIRRDSPLQGKQCPNEMGAAGHRYLFREGDTVLICPRCNTAHHLSCWEYNQHSCMNRVCDYQFSIPERLLDKYRVAPEAKKRFV
jgi:hypothetical protein